MPADLIDPKTISYNSVRFFNKIDAGQCHKNEAMVYQLLKDKDRL
jgi:hypothetical protein